MIPRSRGLAVAACFVPLVLAACGPTAQPAAPKPTTPPASAPTATRPASPAADSPARPTLPSIVLSPSPGAGSAQQRWATPPAMAVDQSKTYRATIETTLGAMQADLFVREAPLTVNNFVFLARQGFYDGVTFHRVIKGFMAQTGDPTGTGRGDAGYKFNDEPPTRPYARGTLAMANSGPNTNGSQFFIVHQNYPLDPKYNVFGMVTQGIETLDKIADVPTGPGRGGTDTPRTEIRITSITIAEQ